MALIEVKRLSVQLKPFLHCPIHKKELSIEVLTTNHNVRMHMWCPVEGCQGSALDRAGEPVKGLWRWEGSQMFHIQERGTKWTESTANAQVMFAMTVGNVGRDIYKVFARCLGARAVSNRRWCYWRKTVLTKGVNKVWETESENARIISQAGEDKDLLTDGTYPTPRHAKYGIVVFLTNVFKLVISLQLGGITKDHSSSYLEKDLTLLGLRFLKEKNIDLRSITHDEHKEITKWVEDNLDELFGYFILHFHDFWHRAKKFGKDFKTAWVAKGGNPEDDEYRTVVNGLKGSLYDGVMKARKQAELSDARKLSDDELRTKVDNATSIFKRLWLKNVDRYRNVSPALAAHVKEMVESFFTEKEYSRFIDYIRTSALEGFNHHLHMFMPKAKHYVFYDPLCKLFCIRWNSARLLKLRRSLENDESGGLAAPYSEAEKANLLILLKDAAVGEDYCDSIAKVLSTFHIKHRPQPRNQDKRKRRVTDIGRKAMKNRKTN
jgi:hypothetical protein